MNTNNYKKEVDWLTTDPDKKLSLVAMGICCIFTGGVAGSLVGLPLIGYMFNALGVGSITYDVYDKTNPHRQLFDNIGLYVGRGTEKRYPRLKRRVKTAYGESLQFKVPVGICSKDFKEKEIELKDHFRQIN